MVAQMVSDLYLPLSPRLWPFAICLPSVRCVPEHQHAGVVVRTAGIAAWRLAHPTCSNFPRTSVALNRSADGTYIPDGEDHVVFIGASV